MIPYVIIFIFALVGLVGWGLKGLIIGFVGGYITCWITGSITLAFSKLFWPPSLIKKQYRNAIAEDFYNEHQKEILGIVKYKIMY